MEISPSIDYWDNIWKTKQTPWEANIINEYLLKYANSHLKLNEGPKRIFLPLCGKSLDLKWFYENGHTVVGLDFAVEPVIEFYETHGYSYTKIKTSYGYRLENDDCRLILHISDLYAMDASILGLFDVIWDRGAIITQSINDLKRYTDLMKSLMAPNCNYLVEVYQFKEQPNVLPTNISDQLFEKLYDGFAIERLDEYDCTDDFYRKKNIMQISRAYFHVTSLK